jgi:phage terminase small subunit
MRAQWKKFADEYLRNGFNGTKAAIFAGYAERSAYNQASRLMNNDEILAYINARLEELTMSADEVLLRLAEHARAEYSQYFTYAQFTDDDGNKEWVVGFDFDRCMADGKMHLIKKVKHDSRGHIEVEFYDAQTALINIGRAHKLFSDGLDMTSGGKPLKLYEGWTPDEWDDDGNEDTDATAEPDAPTGREADSGR